MRTETKRNQVEQLSGSVVVVGWVGTWSVHVAWSHRSTQYTGHHQSVDTQPFHGSQVPCSTTKLINIVLKVVISDFSG